MLGFVVLFWVLEGLLWFVCNPSYCLRRFNRQIFSWRRDSCGGTHFRRSPTDLFTDDKMPQRIRCSPKTETSLILIYSSYEAYPLRTICSSHEFEQVSQIISRQPTAPSI